MKSFSSVIHNPLLKAIFVIVFGFAIFAVCNVSTAKITDVTLCSSINGSGECEGGM